MWDWAASHWKQIVAGTVSAAGALRSAYWFLRERRHGRRIPIIGWAGHLLANEVLLGAMTLRFLLERSKNGKIAATNRDQGIIIDRLLAIVTEAGLESRLDGLDDGLSAYPGTILIRSKPSTDEPSPTTSPKPDASPPTSPPTSATP